MAKKKKKQTNINNGENQMSTNEESLTTGERAQQTETEATTDETTVAEVQEEAPVVEEQETEATTDETTVAEVQEEAPVVEEQETEATTDETTVAEVQEEAPVVEEQETEATVAETMLSKIETFIQRYCADMGPRVPVTNTVGTNNQYSLWKTIESIINIEDPKDFKEQWIMLLKYFAEEKAFGPLYVYRFAEYWRYSEAELTKFQKVLNIMLLTADPAKRADGLKQVDFEIALNENFTEKAVSNLTTFYKS